MKERFSSLSLEERTFELLIVTHVDRDHIEGVLAMLSDPAPPIRFRDIWFNNYDHLRDAQYETFGAVQGERLTNLLLERDLPWNQAFARTSVELREQRSTIPFEGGLTLTLLSPDRTKLEALMPRWEEECRDAGLIPGIPAQRPPPPPGLERMGASTLTVWLLSPSKPIGQRQTGVASQFLLSTRAGD